MKFIFHVFCCVMSQPKFKGWKTKMKYCCTCRQGWSTHEQLCIGYHACTHSQGLCSKYKRLSAFNCAQTALSFLYLHSSCVPALHDLWFITLQLDLPSMKPGNGWTSHKTVLHRRLTVETCKDCHGNQTSWKARWSPHTRTAALQTEKQAYLFGLSTIQ